MRTWVIARSRLPHRRERHGAGRGRRRASIQAVVLALPRRRTRRRKVKLGPPLNGIDGRKAGTFEGFNYSEANKISGITWNEQAFHEYIRAPMQEMPGTRMAFVGIKNDKEIGDLWAYLKQFEAGRGQEVTPAYGARQGIRRPRGGFALQVD